MLMRRLPLLAAIAAAALLGPGVAQAHAATCATHTHTIVAGSWNTTTDQISGISDFQCGGAEGLRYEIVYWLEIKKNSTTWGEADCDAGPCESVKPSSGWYGAGTEHSWTWTFNVAVDITCRFFRPKAQAHFEDGSVSQVWTGQERQTC
jgi:hypothetical protein